MKLKSSKLRDAIVVSLAVGSFAAAGMGTAMAQEASQSQTATSLDTIVVTGTRIKSQTFTASTPVTEITAEEFAQVGATKVEDLVNQFPQIDLAFDSFENNGAWGHATISMRGLGPERTLTLVNGRRLPASRNEITDPSIIPVAALRRVDILSGGASTVYGADAVAGVVNFILNDRFEGVSLTAGYSAYQHDNNNREMQELNADAGFPYPSGSSGLDGASRSIDLVVGSSFADDRGHAMGWLTWRENDALYHSQRDYSACSVWYDYPQCGGSGTADPGRFIVADVNRGFDNDGNPVTTYTGRGNWIYDNAGGYEAGSYIYNYAPVNFYQRPDKRVTAGFAAHYNINDNFTPYVEAMFLDRRSETQIAESGAFGVPIVMNCNDPLIGTLCADAGVTTPEARFTMYKRNVEGGPRHWSANDSTYRLVAGVKGGLFGTAWNYDVSGTWGRTKTTDTGTNDFLINRITAAAAGCNNPTYGTFGGCQLWDIWTDNISPEAAAAMAGTSFSVYNTSYRALSAVADGTLGWGFGSAGGEEVALAVGFERRDYSYTSVYDSDSSAGNFAGAGAADLPVDASNSVSDLFIEAAVPVYVGDGAFNRFDVSLGYRYSDDDTSGSYNTYKLGLSSSLWDNKLLLRGGYNRAVRAPSLNDLYYTQRIALNGTVDLCGGPTPNYTAAQCALAGVPASAYGNVPTNPANQYNGLIGGNPNLKPEVADTYTVGFAIEPIENLNFSLDWYNVEVEGAIAGIGHTTIQRLCVEQGLFCDRIKRDGRFGDYDLWIGLANDPNSGYVINLPDNIGIFKRSGLDFAANYSLDLGPGRLSTSFVANYVLKDFTQSLSSEPSTAFECRGLINDDCGNSPRWRHIASVNYGWGRFNAGLRWRHVGKTDYNDVDGNPMSDVIWLGRGVPSYNYFDLTTNMSIGPALVSFGINNLFDKEPPFTGDSGLSANANAVGGYDQVGRYIFGSINLRF